MSEEFSDSRRRFLGYAIGGVAGAITLAYAVPLANYVVRPALKKEQSEWSKVGLVDDIVAGKPVSMNFSAHTRVGWQDKTVEHDVWVVKEKDGNIKAFSPTCPHLGCGYRWNPDDNLFECPCHSSRFNIEGVVQGGPAPRNLDELPSKIEGGVLFVKFMKFRLGIADKVEA